MTYVLDTNTIIFILNNDKNVEEKGEMAIAAGGKFIIPPVVDYEVQRGLLYKPSLKKESIYFSLRRHYGVGIMTPVTRNTKDFENIVGLQQINWIDN